MRCICHVAQSQPQRTRSRRWQPPWAQPSGTCPVQLPRMPPCAAPAQGCAPRALQSQRHPLPSTAACKEDVRRQAGTPGQNTPLSGSSHSSPSTVSTLPRLVALFHNSSLKLATPQHPQTASGSIAHANTSACAAKCTELCMQAVLALHDSPPFECVCPPATLYAPVAYVVLPIQLVRLKQIRRIRGIGGLQDACSGTNSSTHSLNQAEPPDITIAAATVKSRCVDNAPASHQPQQHSC